MKLDFAKNTRRNAVAGAVSKGIGMLFPFLNRTLFLWLLGPKYLGLNGLFTSVLGVLMLAELGFGTAVICSMYKPIADDDRAMVRAYLKFYRTVYRCVGAVIFLIGLCLLPFLRDLIHGQLPAGINLHVLYLLHLANTSASYFLFAYRGAVIAAHQRHDILTNIRTLTSVVQYVAVFVVLIVTRNYYFYVITTIVFTVAQNLMIVRESRRLFPDIEPEGELDKEKRRKVLSDVKSIFMHKIGAVISRQIDNVVISAFMGLDAVAAYGNYYYVYITVSGIPWIVYHSMMGGFGNKIHTESREENFRLFMRVSRLVGIIIIWCSAVMLALYQPFIREWLRRHNATLLQHFLTPALLVLLFYVNQSRQVLMTFKSAAALWHEDRWKPVVGGVVKLVICLWLIQIMPPSFKFDGVILSSIIGYVVIQIPWESHVLFTKFFGRKEARTYWRHHAAFALLSLIPCAAALAAVNAIPIGGVPGLAVKAVTACAVTTLLVLTLFPTDCVEMFKKALRRN